MLILAALLACHVIDGDTLRCGSERIRLLGIDAPDDPGNGRCRPHPKPDAICDRGRAAASKASLVRLASGSLTIERVGQDRFGRTLAMVYVGGVSLSCSQLVAGQATYVERWDDGRRVARECG